MVLYCSTIQLLPARVVYWKAAKIFTAPMSWVWPLAFCQLKAMAYKSQTTHNISMFGRLLLMWGSIKTQRQTISHFWRWIFFSWNFLSITSLIVLKCFRSNLIIFQFSYSWMEILRYHNPLFRWFTQILKYNMARGSALRSDGKMWGKYFNCFRLIIKVIDKRANLFAHLSVWNWGREYNCDSSLRVSVGLRWEWIVIGSILWTKKVRYSRLLRHWYWVCNNLQWNSARSRLK